jgi:hypothetical protein
VQDFSVHQLASLQGPYPEDSRHLQSRRLIKSYWFEKQATARDSFPTFLTPIFQVSSGSFRENTSRFQAPAIGVQNKTRQRKHDFLDQKISWIAQAIFYLYRNIINMSSTTQQPCMWMAPEPELF